MITSPSSEYMQVRLHQDAPIPLDIRFSCLQHELIVIVGPSGSGKSTLLRGIAGLYKPGQHAISCNNRQWSDHNKRFSLPTQKRRIGMVFQHYALFPHLNVMKNVELACGHLPHAKRTMHVTRMLQLVNLSGLQDRFPSQLSGGQQQRVALARALAREPEILLLDEPFSAVDQVTRRKLRRELALLRQQLNIPIILVTHDLDEARMLADRICILHDGSILQTGTPQEVMTRPVSALVARLIDMVNLFKGIVSHHDPVAGKTFLDWQGRQLECGLNTAFKPGSTVDWVIPTDSIILHRRDRPSRGERENPVSGNIMQSLQLGETTSIIMQLEDARLVMSYNLPTHVARRNNLVEGQPVTVSLLAEAIHLMHP